jgi:YjbE family integral membrane protein
MTLGVVIGAAGAAGAVAAFAQVVMIDLMLASDNAVAVGMAASGLPAKKRRQAIVLGLAGAVVMLIGFALVAVQLLKVIGLLFAGGLLLLWVCWKMYRDLREHGAEVAAEHDLEHIAHGEAVDEVTAVPGKKTKTLAGALFQILLADISMSLDNVLAVAGAAREHPGVLVFGLLLSVTLMGVAASFIAKLMMRFRWLGWIGLAIVILVSGRMIWEGHRDLVVDLNKAAAYNAMVPDFMDISPREAEEHAR